MTAQIPERFEYEGEEYAGLERWGLAQLAEARVFGEKSPEELERLAERMGPVPASPIRALFRERYGKGPLPFRAPHTACCRGYSCSWTIRDGALVLVAFRGWLLG